MVTGGTGLVGVTLPETHKHDKNKPNLIVTVFAKNVSYHFVALSFTQIYTCILFPEKRLLRPERGASISNIILTNYSLILARNFSVNL